MSSPARNESYQYDAVGNRTWQSINGSASTFAYAANSNRLTGVSGGINVSYGYNAYGSTTALNGTAVYGYDAFARLASANGAAFLVTRMRLPGRQQGMKHSRDQMLVPPLAGGAVILRKL